MNLTQFDRRQIFVSLAGIGLGLSGSSAFSQAATFSGRKVISSGFGGSTMDIIQAASFAPFEKATGVASTQVPMQSAAALARMKAEAGNPQLDMYQFSGGQEGYAKEQGLSQPLSGVSRLARIPANLRDPDAHWVSWAVIGEGFLYRKDKISNPPKNYKDLLNPKYKGHIAFPAITNGYGVDLLVMLARAFGGGEANIEPGFDALKKIKGETIFKAASDLPTLFGQGDIWIVPYDTGNAFKLQQSGLPIEFATPDEGSVAVNITACVAKGAKNADVANALIDYMLSPDAQLEVARKMHWAPSNLDTKLPPELASAIPAVDKLIQLDRAKITALRADWTARWNREIAR